MSRVVERCRDGRARGRKDATAAALAFLRGELADAEDEWRLLAAKTEAWLAAALARPGMPARDRLELAIGAVLAAK